MSREIKVTINDVDWDPEGDEFMELAIDLIRVSLNGWTDGMTVEEIDI